MKIIIVIIFLALIGYILEQRRHIKFLNQVNFNQETRHIMVETSTVFVRTPDRHI